MTAFLNKYRSLSLLEKIGIHGTIGASTFVAYTFGMSIVECLEVKRRNKDPFPLPLAVLKAQEVYFIVHLFAGFAGFAYGVLAPITIPATIGAIIYDKIGKRIKKD
jgi:hypothetical protein